MSARAIFFMLLLLGFSVNALSVSSIAKEKYRYTLITDDYGILNQNDLSTYTGRITKVAPFSGSEREFSLSYWQCFPRDHISITLEDMGYSTEDFGWNDSLANLKITAMAKPGIFHEYTMRAVIPTYLYEKKFHLWRNLMKKENYVCLGGEFGDRKNKTREDGMKQEIYSWTFDKIKTKKGCDSFFDDDCNRTDA